MAACTPKETALTPNTVAYSRVIMSHMLLPQDANPAGIVKIRARSAPIAIHRNMDRKARRLRAAPWCGAMAVMCCICPARPASLAMNHGIRMTRRRSSRRRWRTSKP